MSERIMYVTPGISLCGGIRIILEHASRLMRRGHHVELWRPTQSLGSTEWFTGPLPEIRLFNSPHELTSERGIKIATRCDTAFYVAQSMSEEDRGFYLVQDIDEEVYYNKPAKTYDLGLTHLVESRWVERQLKQRFGKESHFISLGIDANVFRDRQCKRDQNRIISAARPNAGPNDLKGWSMTQLVSALVHRRFRAAHLVTYGPEKVGRARGSNHTHIGCISDQDLANWFATSSVFLLTSRHEGFGLTVAEAMCCGVPVVSSFCDGNEEFCIDGETALMADAGDGECLAQHCLTLLHDQELAKRLSANARQIMQKYQWDVCIEKLEKVIMDKSLGILQITSSTNTKATKSIVVNIDDYEYPCISMEPVARKLCTVIPTLNGGKEFDSCLRSATAHGGKIKVVSNGNIDRSVANVDHHGQNIGLSALINSGLIGIDSEYVMLLNDDVELTQAIDPVLDLMDLDKSLAICGWKLLRPSGHVDHAGHRKLPNSVVFLHKATGTTDVQWAVTFAAVIIRRAFIEQAGGLSVAYNITHQDVDYCLLAWYYGWRVAYCADVSSLHHVGLTRGATPLQKLKHPMWLHRERCDEQYFTTKWECVRNMTNPNELAK